MYKILYNNIDLVVPTAVRVVSAMGGGDGGSGEKGKRFFTLFHDALQLIVVHYTTIAKEERLRDI